MDGFYGLTKVGTLLTSLRLWLVQQASRFVLLHVIHHSKTTRVSVNPDGRTTAFDSCRIRSSRNLYDPIALVRAVHQQGALSFDLFLAELRDQDGLRYTLRRFFIWHVVSMGISRL